MRKVTEQIVDAFMGGTPRTVANSHTDGETLWLHGNRIAWKGEHNGAACVFLTLAGWGTPTTRERLQGVLSAMGHRSPHLDDGRRPCLNIHQHKGEQCISVHVVGDDDADETREISRNAVLAVVHPCTAKGMAAVTVLGDDDDDDDAGTYEIVRYFAPHLNRAAEVQRGGLTLEEAQEHCNDPSTHENGEWFDGYRAE